MPVSLEDLRSQNVDQTTSGFCGHEIKNAIYYIRYYDLFEGLRKVKLSLFFIRLKEHKPDVQLN